MKIWYNASFIRRGKIRKQVIELLTKEPLTPTELADKIGCHRESVSRALIQLEEHGIVKCLTPKEKLGRIYSLVNSSIL